MLLSDMSHSRKKNPIRGVTGARSEKADKRHVNRALRQRARQALMAEPETSLTPDRREVRDVWDMAKDGKRYLKDPRPKDLRK
jgi:hypothetical protein